MKLYHVNSASSLRVQYGVELVFGLKCFSETDSFAAPMEAQNGALEKVWLDREKVEREAIAPRAQLRFADWKWDQQVRMVAKVAQLADGGRTGPVSKAIFPNGVTPEVTPSGGQQLKTANALIERISAAKLPEVARLREEWLPKLTGARDQLASALKAREDLYQKLAMARAAEQAARDDHLMAIEKLMGQIRATFPKDVARWDVIFPSAPTRVSAVGTADDSDVRNPDEVPNS
jgi:hypothetical protein